MNRRQTQQDYYAIIGASENASQQDIDRCYKRQAHSRHPDRGGSEEDMKALNQAYETLRDHDKRRAYDAQRRKPTMRRSEHRATAGPAREVGVYGQMLSSLLCVALGLMLLFLVRFNGLFFLWPLGVLAVCVIAFGVLIAHSAMTNARESLAASHPARRFRHTQEVMFWLIVGGGAYGVYLILTGL